MGSRAFFKDSSAAGVLALLRKRNVLRNMKRLVEDYKDYGTGENKSKKKRIVMNYFGDKTKSLRKSRR
jgi:hypothetical protein